MKYYIIYVENCNPSEKVFDTLDDVNNFIEEWVIKYKTLDDKDANYIEKVFYGKKLSVEMTARVVE